MATDSKPLVLYLTSWQKRMVRDFVTASPGAKVKIRDWTRIIVGPGPIKCPASYKIPFHGIRKGDWYLYLTDEQMVQVKEALKLKTAVTGINITDSLIEKKVVGFM